VAKAKVIVIEAVPEAMPMLRANAERNKIDMLDFLLGI